MSIRLSGISKSFFGVKALINVDFEANFGEVRALLGENGAGKSTLIKILSGVYRPDAGEIFIDGEKVEIKNPSDSMAAGIGAVYQEFSLVPSLSVAHNVFLNATGVKKGRMINTRVLEKKTQELFDKYEIEGVRPTDIVHSLGLPQRQMIEIVKALSKDPKVVIFDEATSALSEQKVRWLLGVARRLADENKAVIFISHRLAEIREGCDTVTVFRNGQNVGERVMSETDSDELVAMMLGRRVSAYFPEWEPVIDNESVMLELKDLSVKESLIDINLKLHKGEVMGVGGLAGQGQSLLFQVLYGVIQMTKGEVRIEGVKKIVKSPSESIRSGIALIPEDRGTQGLIDQLSIRKNIILPVLKKLRKWIIIDRKKENELLDQNFSILQIKAENPDVQVMTLSGGNQQKVVFAKMFATQPKILLLYDCTRGVDVGTKAEIFKLVRNFAAGGHALLYYSTDVEELVHLCDKVAVMHDGYIGEILEGEDITKENIILASVGEKINSSKSKGG